MPTGIIVNELSLEDMSNIRLPLYNKGSGLYLKTETLAQTIDDIDDNQIVTGSVMKNTVKELVAIIRLIVLDNRRLSSCLNILQEGG